MEWMRDPGEKPCVAGQIRVLAPQTVGKAVANLCLEIGVTAHSVMVGAAGLVLARNSGTRAPVVGTYVSRRPTRRHHNTIGSFGATVLVPVHVDEGQQLAGFFGQVHRRCKTAYRNADIGLSELLGASRRQEQVPQVAVVSRTFNRERHPKGVERLGDYDRRPAQFPITIYPGIDPNGELEFLVQFQTALPANHGRTSDPTARTTGRRPPIRSRCTGGSRRHAFPWERPV